MSALPRSVSAPRFLPIANFSSAIFTSASNRSRNSFWGVLRSGSRRAQKSAMNFSASVVRRDLLEVLLLGVRREVLVLGRLLPVLVLVEGGAGREARPTRGERGGRGRGSIASWTTPARDARFQVGRLVEARQSATIQERDVRPGARRPAISIRNLGWNPDRRSSRRHEDIGSVTKSKPVQWDRWSVYAGRQRHVECVQSGQLKSRSSLLPDRRIHPIGDRGPGRKSSHLESNGGGRKTHDQEHGSSGFSLCSSRSSSARRRALGQSLTTGSLTGKVENENAGLPGVTVTLTSPRLQGTRTTIDVRERRLHVPGASARRRTPSTFTLQGFKTRHEDRERHGRPAAALDVNMTLSGVQATRDRHREVATSSRRRRRPPRRSRATSRTSSRTPARSRRPRSSPRASTRSRASTQQPAHHGLRRADVRQPLHGGRRRHHGQHPRDAEQPLHRGRDPGDADVRELDLGRVRPLPGRRHQHRHEVRRQLVLGLVPHDVHERRVVRDHARERAARPGRPRALRGDARRAALEGPRLVLRRLPHGRHEPDATTSPTP